MKNKDAINRLASDLEKFTTKIEKEMSEIREEFNRKITDIAFVSAGKINELGKKGKQKEPVKFESGKWYKNVEYGNLIFCKSENDFCGFDHKNKEWYNEMYRPIRVRFIEATPEEVEKALIDYAETHYKPNMRINFPTVFNKIVRIGNVSHKFELIHGVLSFCDTIIYAENNWAQIIKPDFINSLKEVFYRNDKIYWVNKKSLEIMEDVLTEMFIECENLDEYDNQTEVMTKELAEKWIEENKPKKQRLLGIYKVKKTSSDNYGLAKWSGDYWTLFGCDCHYNDEYFYDICEKINLNDQLLIINEIKSTDSRGEVLKEYTI